MDSNLKIRKCKNCKKEFKQKKEWQKYCGAACRMAVNHARKTKMLRQARRIMAAQEAGNR